VVLRQSPFDLAFNITGIKDLKDRKNSIEVEDNFFKGLFIEMEKVLIEFFTVGRSRSRFGKSIY